MISPAGLWEILPDVKSNKVWFSDITDTIWGEDATGSDYYLNGRSDDMRHFDSAIKSIEHFAGVFPEGDPDTVLIAFFPQPLHERYAERGTSGGQAVALL
jgi:hypothetical protein